MSALITMLYSERNYEFTNMAYSMLESMAKQLHCFHWKKDQINNLIRFMKQVGLHKTSYAFGISKYWAQEYQQKEYGYGAYNGFMTIGSEKSLTPAKLEMHVGNVFYNSYLLNLVTVEVRIEGLAKALVKQFNKIPEREWKVEKLASFLANMNVPVKSDQQLKLSLVVKLKGTVMFIKTYEGDSGAQISNFLKDLKGAKGNNDYLLNHQRVLNFGAILYEQPTETGMPAFYYSSLSTMASIQARIQKGLSRGLLFREINFDFRMSTQATEVLSYMVLNSKNIFYVSQNRVYDASIPRHIKAGVNLVKREVVLNLKRPDSQAPTRLLMHSRSAVGVKPMALAGNSQLAAFCPTCSANHVIARGHAKTKLYADNVDEELGTAVKGEFFDCELDLSSANIGFTAPTYIFSPINKRPQTLWSTFVMGLRQARDFMMFYPRTEKCGAYFQWSQSPGNPVNEIAIKVQGKNAPYNRKYVFEGSKFLMKTTVEFKGTQARVYIFNMKYEGSPGGETTDVRAQFSRKANSALNLGPYTICFSANNKNPELPATMYGYPLDEQKEMTGKMMFKYGQTEKCNDAPGSITVDIKQSTTEEALTSLRTEPYYQTCMAEKASPEWRLSPGLPVTRACRLAGRDATLARQYSWDTKFENISPEIDSLLTKSLTTFKAFMLPFWTSAASSAADLTAGNPFLKLDVLFKNRDRLVDVGLATDKGANTFNDMEASFDRFDGTLNSLQFDPIGANLAMASLVGKFLHRRT